MSSVKIDFKKKPNDNKDVTIGVHPLFETITMVQKGKKGEKWEYKRPKGGEGIKHMTINWKRGSLTSRLEMILVTKSS